MGDEAAGPTFCASLCLRLFHTHYVIVPSQDLLKKVVAFPGNQGGNSGVTAHAPRSQDDPAYPVLHIVFDQEKVGGCLSPQGLQKLDRTPSAHLELWARSGGCCFFLLTRMLTPGEHTVTGGALLEKWPN